MSRNNYWLACGLFCLLLAACSEEDGDGKDLDKPLIESGDSASPLNCQVYRTGIYYDKVREFSPLRCVPNRAVFSPSRYTLPEM